MIRTKVLKHLARAREEGEKEMSGEERLPEERRGESMCVRVVEEKEVRGDDSIK